MTAPIAPKVSVIMPVRNGALTITEAIQSILSQSLADFELIIINDNSTDETEQIVGSFSQHDPRLRLIASQGQGISAALNTGLDQARGTYIARMDADDICLPLRLEKQVEAFEANASLVLLGTFCETFSGTENTGKEKTLPTSDSQLRYCLRSAPTFFHPSIMVENQALKKIGGYRSFFNGAEDHDLYLRLSAHGQVATVPEVLLRYRLHPEQETQKKKSKCHIASAAALQSYEHVSRGLPDPAENATATTKDLAFDFFRSLSTETTAITTDRLKLFIRISRALKHEGQDTKTINGLFLKRSLKNFQLNSFFKIYRKLFIQG